MNVLCSWGVGEFAPLWIVMYRYLVNTDGVGPAETHLMGSEEPLGRGEDNSSREMSAIVSFTQ